MKIQNKKGGGKILSVYWFAILLIIAGGVALMVYLFYGTPYDVRKLETHILTNQIADCISYAGKINSNLISKGAVSNTGKTFLETCHLKFDSEFGKIEQYYAEVNLYKFPDMENPVLTMKKGNSDFTSSCKIQQEKEYSSLPKCDERSFYSTDDLKNQYIIKILTIVAKLEKNAKS